MTDMSRGSCRFCGRSVIAQGDSISHAEPPCEAFLEELRVIAREHGLVIEHHGLIGYPVPPSNLLGRSTHYFALGRIVCARGQA